MFEKITPEQAGIESRYIADYISLLERRGMTTHSVLMMKGDYLFAEYYWAPFHKDFLHRMYSQTKSYVSLAIGLLEEEGKLSLDDPIVKYFPEKVRRDPPEYLKKQTVRDMLMMETACHPPYWFSTQNPDRTDEYMNDSATVRPSRTLWEYDSAGSQVLSSLAEKLTGMKLLDYLKLKIFNKVGTFRTARILETPNGDSWGDSALLCTSRDMASGGRFVMNYGKWNGEQLLNERYLREATSALVDNNVDGFEGCFRHGYGYQIWKTERDGFAFVGMGDQITVCVPDKDFIFVITSDNQFLAQAREVIVDALFDIIVEHIGDSPAAIDRAEIKRLEMLTSDLKLRSVKGMTSVPLAEKISGKRFVCPENKTSIKEFTLSFREDHGAFSYINAQGKKEIRFGMCRNEFGKFPQLGYSDERGGTVSTDGYMYDCACSAAWREPEKLMLRVQIIDKYLGNMTVIFAFRDREVCVKMIGNAENFLKEYNGEFVARLAD
ncbi:MAG: serine hydrolase [Clostridia bacterium]|nr:serine hydrolase [Clostridia bacterium]